MKKILAAILTLSLCIVSTATLSTAAFRHYRHHDYSFDRHHPHYYHHYRHTYHRSDYLPFLGIGLLAGAVIGSMVYEPYRQPRTVIYSTPPPIIVQPEPVEPIDTFTTYEEPRPEQVLRQVRITGKIVNVRATPDLDSDIIDQALEGQTVDVIGAAPEWLYVRTETGRYGWVMTQYTVVSAEPVG